jgi:hypothetical protein
MQRKTIGVYSEKNAKHTNALCGQNAERLNVKAAGIYSNNYVLQGE